MKFSKETKDQIFNEIKNAKSRERKIMELAIKYNTTYGSIKFMFYKHDSHPVTNRKWTPEMDLDLYEHIKANPINLQQVFREFARKYNKSTNAVSVRWYTRNNAPECFEISSEKIITINRKNI